VVHHIVSRFQSLAIKTPFLRIVEIIETINNQLIV